MTASQHPGEGREDGWEELRREIEALASPLTRAISANPAETYKRGHVSAVTAVLAIVDRLAAVRGEPEPIDVERFREAYWQEHSTLLIRRIHPEYRAGSDKRADSLLSRLNADSTLSPWATSDDVWEGGSE